MLIVGLGNPDAKYFGTRHNIGQEILYKIRERYHGSDWKKKHNGLLSDIKIANKQIHLLFPTTYMNKSGLAVTSCCSFFKYKPEEIFVIHDDLDLAVGKVKIKQGGGHGGHNGLRDIDRHIGKNYFRMRIGIDHPEKLTPPLAINVASYVLNNIPKHDQPIFTKIAEFIADNIELLLEKKADKFLNDYSLMAKSF